jgi:G3E family GTPase
MNNGCICCTVRGDLIKILGSLKDKRASGALKFDRVIIETTGLANPGPVAQTFFMDEGIHDQYLLDAVVTVVDAKHAGKALDDHDEARRQVGFADRILLSKTDLVEDAKVDELAQRLRRMNPRAQQKKVHMGETDIKELIDIRGFNLNAALEVDPEFLTSDYHEHDDDVTSFVWKDPRPMQMEKIETFLSLMVQNYGEDLLRYKGVLNIQGEPRRMIFQGVHMLMGGSPGKPWEPGETRESVMVFIGRKIPRRLFEEGLAYCVA